MKYLKHWNQSLVGNHAVGRFIGINGSLEAQEGLEPGWEENNSLLSGRNRSELDDVEKADEINDLLNNPLRFSLHDIRFLEENQEIINRDKALQKAFRRTVDHFLSLAKENSLAFPQSLFYLKSSRLSRFIPLKQIEAIKVLVGQEIKKINKLGERDPGSWTTNEAAKVLSLYKHLKRRSIESEYLDETFIKISKGLVEKALDIAQSSQNGLSGELRNAEKLILWDIQRLFPDEFRTNDRVSAILSGEAQDQAQRLLADLDAENDINNDPDLFWVWNSLEDLATQQNIQLTDQQHRKLRKFMLRYNAAQLLESTQDSSVLLPSHLHALSKLRQDPELLQVLEEDKESQVREEFQPHQPKEEQYREKQLLSKIQEKQSQLDAARDHEVSLLLKNDALTQDNRDGYNQAQESLVEYVTGERENSVDNIMQAFREFSLLADSESFQAKISYENDKWNRARSKTPPNFRDQLTTLKSIINNTQSWASSSNNREAIGDNRETLNQHISKLDNVMEEWEKLWHKVQEKENVIRNQVKAVPNEDIKKLEEERREIQLQYSRQKHEASHARNFFELARDTKKKAQEIEDTYWESLNQRIKNHRLHAADIEVLFHYDITQDEFEANEQEIKQDLSKDVQNIEPPEIYQKFKQEFKAILDDVDLDVLPEIDLEKIDQDELDVFTPWLKAIEDRLGVGAFQSELGVELSKFTSSQAKSELLKGAMAYYKDDILQKVEAALPENLEKDQKQKFLNTLRLHQTVGSPSDIESIDASYDQYKRLQKADDLKLDVERNNLKSALEGIDEENQSKIEAAFRVNENMMRYGFSIDSDGQIFPGTEKLEALRLQMLPLTREMLNFWEPHLEAFSSIAHNATHKEEMSEISNKAQIEAFIVNWEKVIQLQARDLIQQFKTQIRAEFSVEEQPAFQGFIAQLEDVIDTQFESIESDVTKFIEAYRSGIIFTGQENFFQNLPLRIKKLTALMDFDKGFTAQNKADFEKIFYAANGDDKNRGFANTVQKLKKWGLFDSDETDEDNETGQKKAQERFAEIQADFKEKSSIFNQNIKGIKLRVEKDKKLSDEDFQAKYGFTKDEADNILSGYDEYNEAFNAQWKAFESPTFFQDWWQDYQRDDVSRAEAINRFHQLEDLTETSKELAESSKGIGEWLRNWNENAQAKGGGISWQRISLYDIYLIIKGCVENHEKNWKRKREASAYQLGQDLFGDTLWGKEFRRLAEESEEARIKEWEGNYHDLDGWDIREKLYNSKDADESRACINLLSEKGFLAWDDPRLWRTLMRLGGGIIFNIPEDQALPIGDIMEKVKGSCELIWSRDVFRNWEGKFKGDHEKAMGFFEREFSNLESSPSGRTDALSGMLARWKRGEVTDVDPAKYEQFIVQAIKAGKMNGQPDTRWYYLVMGVGIKNPQGQSILSREVFQRIQELMNNMPHVEFFVDKNSYKHKGRVVPEDYPGAEKRQWGFEDFEIWAKQLSLDGTDTSFDIANNKAVQEATIDFFYKNIRASEQARDRAQRVQRNAKGEADHDDAATFAAEWGMDQVRDALVSLSEGTTKLTPDFWRTFLDGYNNYFKKTYEIIIEGDKEFGNLSGWHKERTRLLEEVGQRLRTAFLATQTLTGNADLKASGRNTTFDKASWDKETVYSPKASESRGKINGFVNGVLRSNKSEKKYLDIVDRNLAAEGADYKSEKFKTVNQLNKDLAEGNVGDDIFLGNPDVIFANLEKYVKEHGGPKIKVDLMESSNNDENGGHSALTA